MALKAFNQAWDIPDLQKRLKFLLFALFIYVIASHIPTPGVDPRAMERLFGGMGDGGIFGLIDLFSGGSFRRLSILALGIMPYINASIMMQVLSYIYPALKKIQQEGEEGRRTVAKWTRYLTIALAFVQGGGVIYAMYGQATPDYFMLSVALFSLVGGTCVLMWLGEQIGEKGIGNGASIIITVGIVYSIPSWLLRELMKLTNDPRFILNLILFAVFAVLVVVVIVIFLLAHRKIPIQYARRQIGTKVYSGGSSYLPIRVNQAGVIPIIFATSLLLLPATVGRWIPALNTAFADFSGSILYSILDFGLVFWFTFLYTAVTFDPVDVADNLKKHGGFIPGIRPGKPTAEFLDKVLNRVTVIGALFLGTVSILPNVLTGITGVQSYYLGGTSILIVIGVALDTISQLQAQLVMRHYSGFTK